MNDNLENKSYVYNLDECNIPGKQCFSGDGMGLKCNKFKVEFPPQMQTNQQGHEYLMVPRPIFDNPNYKASDDSSFMTVQVLHINGGQYKG